MWHPILKSVHILTWPCSEQEVCVEPNTLPLWSIFWCCQLWWTEPITPSAYRCLDSKLCVHHRTCSRDPNLPPCALVWIKWTLSKPLHMLCFWFLQFPPIHHSSCLIQFQIINKLIHLPGWVGISYIILTLRRWDCICHRPSYSGLFKLSKNSCLWGFGKFDDILTWFLDWPSQWSRWSLWDSLTPDCHIGQWPLWPCLTLCFIICLSLSTDVGATE